MQLSVELSNTHSCAAATPPAVALRAEEVERANLAASASGPDISPKFVKSSPPPTGIVIAANEKSDCIGLLVTRFGCGRGCVPVGNADAAKVSEEVLAVAVMLSGSQ